MLLQIAREVVPHTLTSTLTHTLTHRVHHFASALRARACEVIELAWPESEHCGHLRRHSSAYREGVAALLQRVQVRLCVLFSVCVSVSCCLDAS